jgi:xanthine dehydrogenase accessory factor
MKKLVAALSRALDGGHAAVLCGIVASHGSTPRGAGAKMLILEDGAALGTIGGGAVELRASALAGEMLRERRSGFQDYRLSAGEIADIGMICGGDVRVFFQYFAPEDVAARRVLGELPTLLDASAPSWLITAIDGDAWSIGAYDRQGGLRGLEIPMERLAPLLCSRGTLDEGAPTLFVEPLARAGTVYLFGAGHVARELAHILAMAGFRVVVWDQREQAAARAFFPEAAALHCGPFSTALACLDPITAEDYVVIMTPGHQADYEVLAQALRTPAKYIGCIGSRKKVAAARERLLADGFSEEEIRRVYAPIGLPIGGETPAEVAVSVAAQLIACRWGRLERFL